jgi:chorismate mutase/prephenate dehydratase
MKAWKYYFFLDMEGHCEEGKLKNALHELGKKCDFVKILGSYPKA